MRNIGLTGGIACGKSKTAYLFENMGFYTIDSDIISRKIMEKNQPAYNEIINHFGTEILDSEKNIVRKILGKIVFADKTKLKVLENITHPAIIEYEKKLRSSIYGRDSKAVIITHAAKMIESGSFKSYDALIVVTCSKDIQVKRVMARDNISYDTALQIINNQLTNEERLKYADFIIDNSGSETDLMQEVKRVHNLITQINYGEKHS